MTTGVSIESASYIENNLDENKEISETHEQSNDEVHSPKLFSDEQSYDITTNNTEKDESEKYQTDQLFNQDIHEEEDFEIPAFLRKQKVLMKKLFVNDQSYTITGILPFSSDAK